MSADHEKANMICGKCGERGHITGDHYTGKLPEHPPAQVVEAPRPVTGTPLTGEEGSDGLEVERGRSTEPERPGDLVRCQSCGVDLPILWEGPSGRPSPCSGRGHDPAVPVLQGGATDASLTPDKPAKPWPERCEQRAFVQGAKWWEFTKTGGTMWQSDQRDAEAEAVRRYGEPSR